MFIQPTWLNKMCRRQYNRARSKDRSPSPSARRHRFMTHLLFTLSLKRKRDLLRARQLVRHVAHLLGFSGADQLCLTATVFELACQAWTPSKRARISCEIAENCLQVVCTPRLKERPSQGLEKLPAGCVSKP